MSLLCGEELASVARCKVTMSFPAVVLYEIYTEIYMYNLVLYPVENVWSEPGIMPYFAPSTTGNALSSGAKILNLLTREFSFNTMIYFVA